MLEPRVRGEPAPSPDVEVDVLAGAVVAGKVADKRVVPWLEVERDGFPLAGGEVARLSDVAGLVRAGALEQRAGWSRCLQHDELVWDRSAVLYREGDSACCGLPDSRVDRELLEADIDPMSWCGR